MITATTVPTDQACIWAQLHHPKRHSGTRIGVPVAASANKGVYVRGEVLFAYGRGCVFRNFLLFTTCKR